MRHRVRVVVVVVRAVVVRVVGIRAVVHFGRTVGRTVVGLLVLIVIWRRSRRRRALLLSHVLTLRSLALRHIVVGSGRRSRLGWSGVLSRGARIILRGGRTVLGLRRWRRGILCRDGGGGLRHLFLTRLHVVRQREFVPVVFSLNPDFMQVIVIPYV